MLLSMISRSVSASSALSQAFNDMLRGSCESDLLFSDMLQALHCFTKDSITDFVYTPSIVELRDQSDGSIVSEPFRSFDCISWGRGGDKSRGSNRKMSRVLEQREGNALLEMEGSLRQVGSKRRDRTGIASKS